MKISITAALCIFLSPSCWAASIIIDNFSFEQDVTGYGTFPVGNLPTGWLPYDPNNLYASNGNYRGVVHPNEDFFLTNPGDSTSEVPVGQNVPDGVNAALIWLDGAQNGQAAGIRQILTTELVPNTEYTLSVGIGNIGSGTGANSVFYELGDFPGYSVELWAGGMLLERDYNSLEVPEREWRTSTVNYVSGNDIVPGQALEIRLINLDLDNPGVNGPGIEVDFDNVRLDATAIPEPSTIGILAFTLLWMTGQRRRTQ